MNLAANIIEKCSDVCHTSAIIGDLHDQEEFQGNCCAVIFIDITVVTEISRNIVITGCLECVIDTHNESGDYCYYIYGVMNTAFRLQALLLRKTITNNNQKERQRWKYVIFDSI